jgi:Mor family transcriptional regulator
MTRKMGLEESLTLARLWSNIARQARESHWDVTSQSFARTNRDYFMRDSQRLGAETWEIRKRTRLSDSRVREILKYRTEGEEE